MTSESELEETLYVVAVDGLTLYGPFDNEAKAKTWAEENGEPYDIVPLSPVLDPELEIENEDI